MLWKGFQRPKRLEFERETLTDRFGRFYAQPFERGLDHERTACPTWGVR